MCLCQWKWWHSTYETVITNGGGIATSHWRIELLRMVWVRVRLRDMKSNSNGGESNRLEGKLEKEEANTKK